MTVALKQYENPIIEAVEKATTNPDWFASEILRMPNDAFQSELLNAVADLDRIRRGIPTLYNHEGKQRFSVRSCHGTGKTHTLGKLMHWFNFTRKGRIPVTAPKEKQVTTRVWPEFRKIRGTSIAAYKQLIKVDKTQITWCGDVDWCALVEAASQSENLQGLHDKHLLFLVEEASGVDESMFPVIEGALSTETAIMVLIGNPTKVEGEFYNSHRKPGTTELYYTMHVKPEDSPRVSMKWVNEMKRKYGERSPVYLVRCLGEFSEMSDNQLISMAWIDRAKNRVFKLDGSLPVKRLSIDVADGGEAETVITVASRYDSFLFLQKQFRFSFPTAESPRLAAEAAIEIWKRFDMKVERGDDIVVDALGVGAGTAGNLIDAEYPVVIYKGGGASDDNKQWLNRRTQSYISLRDAFRDDQIIIAETFYDETSYTDGRSDWDDLIGQLTAIKTNAVVDKLEALEPKHRLLVSPDMADSIAMQFATQQPTIGSTSFDPALLGNTEFSNYDASLT